MKILMVTTMVSSLATFGLLLAIFLYSPIFQVREPPPPGCSLPKTN